MDDKVIDVDTKPVIKALNSLQSTLVRMEATISKIVSKVSNVIKSIADIVKKNCRDNH